MLVKINFRLEKIFILAFSPEREDPNNPDFSTVDNTKGSWWCNTKMS